MTLWNLIRDFFVENIFGGYLSNGTIISNNVISGTNSAVNTTSNIQFSIPTWLKGSTEFKLSLGDWLSTSFTIITLILLVFFLYIFVKWIFRIFAGLLSR